MLKFSLFHQENLCIFLFINIDNTNELHTPHRYPTPSKEKKNKNKKPPLTQFSSLNDHWVTWFYCANNAIKVLLLISRSIQQPAAVKIIVSHLFFVQKSEQIFPLYLIHFMENEPRVIYYGTVNLIISLCTRQLDCFTTATWCFTTLIFGDKD